MQLLYVLCIGQVLSVLWDLETEEVEDILQEFVNKSLLFRDCNRRPYLYYLHDLQVDFLLEQNRSCIQVCIAMYGNFCSEPLSVSTGHIKRSPPFNCLLWLLPSSRQNYCIVLVSLGGIYYWNGR